MPILELIQNWQKQHPCSTGRLMCHFCKEWDIGPKLAEPIFYQLRHISNWSEIDRNSTPVLYGSWCAILPKMEPRAKVGRIYFLPIMAHFQLIQNGQKQQPKSRNFLLILPVTERRSETPRVLHKVSLAHLRQAFQKKRDFRPLWTYLPAWTPHTCPEV